MPFPTQWAVRPLEFRMAMAEREPSHPLIGVLAVRARYDPLCAAVLNAARHTGGLTMEQLAEMVRLQSEGAESLRCQVVKLAKMQPPPPIVIAKDPL